LSRGIKTEKRNGKFDRGVFNGRQGDRRHIANALGCALSLFRSARISVSPHRLPDGDIFLCRRIRRQIHCRGVESLRSRSQIIELGSEIRILGELKLASDHSTPEAFVKIRDRFCARVIIRNPCSSLYIETIPIFEHL